jgi:hypothetical protein
LSQEFEQGSFDGAFSNFGGLNCISDLTTTAQALSHWIAPNGKVILVVMGPLCVWEMLWQLFHFRFRKILRRLWLSGASAKVADNQLKVYFHWPSHAEQVFKNAGFKVIGYHGLGIFLPPSLLSVIMSRWISGESSWSFEGVLRLRNLKSSDARASNKPAHDVPPLLLTRANVIKARLRKIRARFVKEMLLIAAGIDDVVDNWWPFKFLGDCYVLELQKQ